MSRPETLIAAIAKNATYVANLDAAAKKKPLNAKQKASRASAVEKFDTYVLEYANLLAGTPTAPPTAPPVTPPKGADPFPGKSMAERALAWDRDEAQRAIDDALAGLVFPGLEEKLAALDPVLRAKALALGKLAGAPGSRAGVDYDPALPYGGVWTITSGRDEGDGQGGGSDYAQAWQGSELVKTYRNRGADPVADNGQIARELGFDIAHPDRPAPDYKGKFTAPIDF